jgi:hypothetical protein
MKVEGRELEVEGLKIQRLSFEGHKVEVKTPRAVRGKVEVERSTRESRHKKVVRKRVNAKKVDGGSWMAEMKRL